MNLFTESEVSKVLVGLTGCQQKAYLTYIDFKQDKKAKTMSLTGYAGTGKTFLLKHIIEDAKSSSKLIVCATIHRAKEVLRREMIGLVPIHTLARVLGLQLGVEVDGFSLGDKKFIPKGTSMIERDSLVIIDESSLINDVLFNHLVNICNTKGAKILFVGDAGQLKPVKQKHITKAFTDTDYSVNMTEIKRTSDGNPMPEMVLYKIRQDFNSDVDNFRHIAYLNDKKEGISFTANKTAWEGSLCRAFASENFQQNRQYIRGLTFTNQRTDELNLMIRESLFGTVSKYNEGEMMTMYSSRLLDGDDYLLPNGMDIILRDIRSGTHTVEDIDIDGYYMDVYDSVTNEFIVDIFAVGDVIPYDYFALLNQVKDEAIEARKNDNPGLAASLWKKYFNLAEHVYFVEDLYVSEGVVMNYRDAKQAIAKRFPGLWGDHLAKEIGKHKITDKTFNYGYVHTVHKSQGGTYDYTFVDENDIDIQRNFRKQNKDVELINQLKYVGFSRSRIQTVVLSSLTERV